MKILLPFLFVTTYIECVQWEKRCILPNSKTGICTAVEDCKNIKDIYKGLSLETVLQYQNWCNYDVKADEVCCTKSSSQSSPTKPDNQCLTHDNQEGRCVDWSTCSHLLNSIKHYNINDIPNAIYNYISRYQCNGSVKNGVCCAVPTTSSISTTPSPTVYTSPAQPPASPAQPSGSRAQPPASPAQPPASPAQPPTPLHQPPTSPPSAMNNRAGTASGVCTSSAQPPDRSTSCCGISEKDNNRIIGGTEAGILQYPWMALIEYEDKHCKQPLVYLLCAGVLISGKYVLTASHCISGTKTHEMVKPVRVRLGEYDINNSTVDCVAVDGGGYECTSGIIKATIDNITLHPEYKSDRTRVVNDIALIRLREMIKYTDNIRPICLPSKDVIREFSASTRFYIAGWGATASNNYSNILLHVDVPYVPMNMCKAKFKYVIGTGHICAGGEVGRDSCFGDSGGPLMYEKGNVNELVGIVSFGIQCSLQNVPAVYTDVSHYLPWIWSHIAD